MAKPMIRLSDLFNDPFLRDAFLRAEGDHPGEDDAVAVATDHPRKLDGGAAERLCTATGRRVRVGG